MDPSRGPLLPTGEGTAQVVRREPSAGLREFVVHYWLPSWDIPPGASHEQRILTYPGCNLVVENGVGTLYGRSLTCPSNGFRVRVTPSGHCCARATDPCSAPCPSRS